MQGTVLPGVTEGLSESLALLWLVSHTGTEPLAALPHHGAGPITAGA